MCWALQILMIIMINNWIAGLQDPKSMQSDLERVHSEEQGLVLTIWAAWKKPSDAERTYLKAAILSYSPLMAVHWRWTGKNRTTFPSSHGWQLMLLKVDQLAKKILYTLDIPSPHKIAIGRTTMESTLVAKVHDWQIHGIFWKGYKGPRPIWNLMPADYCWPCCRVHTYRLAGTRE